MLPLACRNSRSAESGSGFLTEQVEGHVMTDPTRRSLLRTAAALLIVSTAPALAQGNKDQAMTSLFKIISVKDEIVIGLNADEMAALGGNDAGAIAKALAEKRTLSVWQYATRKAQNGDLEQAPRARIGLIAHDSLRVEPYKTPLKVIAHD
jgi:hypothetical protein